MTGVDTWDDHAVRRLRCYELAYIVPWTEIIEDMEASR